MNDTKLQDLVLEHYNGHLTMLEMLEAAYNLGFDDAQGVS